MPVSRSYSKNNTGTVFFLRHGVITRKSNKQNEMIRVITIHLIAESLFMSTKIYISICYNLSYCQRQRGPYFLRHSVLAWCICDEIYHAVFEQFWLDALPDSIKDSRRHQQWLWVMNGKLFPHPRIFEAHTNNSAPSEVLRKAVFHFAVPFIHISHWYRISVEIKLYCSTTYPPVLSDTATILLSDEHNSLITENELQQ